MKEIGGFFELELERKIEYHSKAVKLNSGRNALRYILKATRPKKIQIPHYICDSVIAAAQEENILIEQYHINEKFEPLINKNSLDTTTFILYVNYFGIHDEVVAGLAKKHKTLIVDNAQSFFSHPTSNYHTIYSPRKFFGVCDGGYLYTDRKLPEQLETDKSYKRCEHLLKRIDAGAQASYELYKKNEERFHMRPIRCMSKLTQNILASIDYENAKKKRQENFLALHEYLSNTNELYFSTTKLNGPMIYPLLIFKKGLKEYLIKNNIYIATYWSDVQKKVEKDSFEYELVKNLVPLPIDQRYNLNDMRIIAKKISNFF